MSKFQYQFYISLISQEKLLKFHHVLCKEEKRYINNIANFEIFTMNLFDLPVHNALDDFRVGNLLRIVTTNYEWRYFIGFRTFDFIK